MKTHLIPFSSSEEQIKVIIRIRPFLNKNFKNPNSSNSDPSLSPIIKDKTDLQRIRIGKGTSYYESYYNHIFYDDSTQEDIYNFIKVCIGDAKKGINSTILAYGQTGSGKTFTMFGQEWTNNDEDFLRNDYKKDEFNFLYTPLIISPYDDKNGIIPRILNDVFNTDNNSNDFLINCSYVQIYNEKIYDLLENYDIFQYVDLDDYNSSKNKKDFRVAGKNDFTTINPIELTPLQIRQDKNIGIFIDGLSQYPVEDFNSCINFLKIGEFNRKKRQSSKNELSSRSHTIFMISFTSREPDKNGFIIESRINFCDLAGSEKYDQFYNYNKLHMSELININKSLSALGNVINALVSKKTYIPYRDSKLTQLLQNSLGGNTQTVLIGNISPELEAFNETLNTLKFADRAHSLMCKIEPNKILLNDDGGNNEPKEFIINKLTKEVNELKQLLNIRQKNGIIPAFGLPGNPNMNMNVNNICNNNDKDSRYSKVIENQLIKLKRENEKLKIELKRANMKNFENINNSVNDIINYKNNKNSVIAKNNVNFNNNNLDNLIGNKLLNSSNNHIHSKKSEDQNLHYSYQNLSKNINNVLNESLQLKSANNNYEGNNSISNNSVTNTNTNTYNLNKNNYYYNESPYYGFKQNKNYSVKGDNTSYLNKKGTNNNILSKVAESIFTDYRANSIGQKSNRKNNYQTQLKRKASPNQINNLEGIDALSYLNKMKEENDMKMLKEIEEIKKNSKLKRSQLVYV